MKKKATVAKFSAIAPYKPIKVDLHSVCRNSVVMIDPAAKDAPQIDYGSKEKALSIIYDGYPMLPSAYQEVFLDPLRDLLKTNDYSDILQSMDIDGQGPWHDWLAAIYQRAKGFQKNATYAFEELVNDLYNGFLEREEGKRIKPPDDETVSPLIAWGHPVRGPFTWAADVGVSFGVAGMKMSVVNLPPLYSQNIALWPPLGHETGGHDIIRAYHGMSDELGTKVSSRLLEHKDDPKLKGKVNVNGREETVAAYAARYWKDRIDETAADVCGHLNLGPASGISIAVLSITFQIIFSQEEKINNMTLYDDTHPIDAFRIFLAADVIRNIRELDLSIANTWADVLEGIASEYIRDKSGFYLVSSDPDGTLYANVKMPFREFRETIKIVADTIANEPVSNLGNHSLSDVNTWANDDELLTMGITKDLLNKKEPSLNSDGQTVYAAHIVGASTIAIAMGSDITKTTEFAINSLNKLYNQYLLTQKIPRRSRSGVGRHSLITSFRGKTKS